MTPERWKQVESILHEALAQPPPARASFLDQACAGDDDLKNETTTLIAAHEAAGDFIEQPAIAHDARVILNYQSEKNIGRELGSYRIVESLGAGGMGEVYLAEDSKLERLVALKMLPAYFAADDERLARFHREARSASALNHPNILTIHEVGEVDEVRFIATEFIDGETIQELIFQGTLTLKDIFEIAIQVLTGLAAAHVAGIVHRDIKPDNIMRRRDGLVKLLDFGIAKLLEPTTDGNAAMQTESGALLGTVGYMSPEQARGVTIDERTDIWSFGVVLYQMLSGRLPFVGATRMDTLVNILEREPEPLLDMNIQSVSPELRALNQVIRKTLAKNPDDRYQTVAELLSELKSIRLKFEKPSWNEVWTPERFSPLQAAGVSSHGATGHRGILLWGGLAVIAVAVLVGAFAYKRTFTTKSETPSIAHQIKSYPEMTEHEQLVFIGAQEQRISAMMGDRPGRVDEEGLRAIKRHIDRYVARGRSDSQQAGGESLQQVYARAKPYLPTIARAFSSRKVPVIIGIYLPMIESAYEPCFESSMGGKGLFQFLPDTARRYGVSPNDRCDVNQAAPAAANYIADHMAELGDDAESMTLVLLSYNHGATWVRGTLRQLRETENFDRTFWTLFRNRDQLDESFRNEGANYVPMFFAAAIIGESPRAFGLEMEPLSTLTGQ